MTDTRSSDPQLDERVGNISKNLSVMNEAVRAALRDHLLAGNPVAAWRDGEVVWIQSEDLAAELDALASDPSVEMVAE